MIYTDGVHMISDKSISELHEFAARLGLNKCWFENRRNKGHPHYDLKPAQAEAAVAAGAVKVSSRDIVTILKPQLSLY